MRWRGRGARVFEKEAHHASCEQRMKLAINRDNRYGAARCLQEFTLLLRAMLSYYAIREDDAALRAIRIGLLLRAPSALMNIRAL